MNIAELNKLGNTRTDTVNQTLVNLIETFSKKEFPDIVTKAYIETAGKPSDKWSLGNKIMMIAFGTFDARGYKQWQAVGRNPLDWTKWIPILAPVPKTIKKEVSKIVEGHEKTEEETFTIMTFKTIRVYAVENTYGKELEVYKPKQIPPLLDVAAKWNIMVKYDSTHHGEYGSYSPVDNTIRLCTEDQGTFFHELSHKADEIIQEKNGKKLKMGQDPEQETVAQLSACVLAHMYGYNVEAYTWNYIGHYAGDKKPETVAKMCLRVLDRVQKVINLILDTKTSLEYEMVTHTPQSQGDENSLVIVAQ